MPPVAPRENHLWEPQLGVCAAPDHAVWVCDPARAPSPVCVTPIIVARSTRTKGRKGGTLRKREPYLRSRSKARLGQCSPPPRGLAPKCRLPITRSDAGASTPAKHAETEHCAPLVPPPQHSHSSL